MNHLTRHLRRSRQALGLLCLFNIALMTVGLPVPKPNVKDRSTPFPCMDSRCGCMTAEDCWKHCCCHTTEEKLAWAKEHGITPPQYVLDQYAKESDEAGCCHSCEQENNSSSVSTTKKSCCSHSACCDNEEVEENPDTSFTWLVTIQALKCQGHDGWSLLSNTVVVDPTENEPVVLSCPPIEQVCCTDCLLVSHPTTPAAPPPKRS